MKQLTKYKLLTLCFTCMLFCVQVNAQQRASERPLSAFYSAEMKKKMDAVQPQQQAAKEKRASEQPLSAFLSKDMQTRLNTRTPQPSTPKTVKRASQRSLSAFATKAVRDRISPKPHVLLPSAASK